MDAIQIKLENKAVRRFVTGDTYGGLDAGKFSSRNFSEGCGLTKDDSVVVAGCFGLP